MTQPASKKLHLFPFFQKFLSTHSTCGSRIKFEMTIKQKETERENWSFQWRALSMTNTLLDSPRISGDGTFNLGISSGSTFLGGSQSLLHSQYRRISSRAIFFSGNRVMWRLQARPRSIPEWANQRSCYESWGVCAITESWMRLKKIHSGDGFQGLWEQTTRCIWVLRNRLVKYLLEAQRYNNQYQST